MDAPHDFLTIEHEVSGDGGTVRLRLDGEVDTGTVPQVEEALASVLDGPSARLVVDLAGVAFMDSSGLRVLVVARNALEDRGGELVLAQVGDQLRRVFELSGLTDAFTLEP